MSYHDVFKLTGDADFNGRVAACFAVETLDNPNALDPWSWAGQHSWDMAAQPGFGDAYASAVAGGVENPGADPSVISDAQLLSGVQLVVAGELPGPPAA
jgi:hypothetical protein